MHATVAVMKLDGTVELVCLDVLGHVSDAGRLLASKYDTQEAAEALVALGDVLQLTDTLEESTFYARDEGYPFDDVQPEPFESEEVYAKLLDDTAPKTPFNYIFKGERWFVWDGQVPLACAMKVTPTSTDEEYEEGMKELLITP